MQVVIFVHVLGIAVDQGTGIEPEKLTGLARVLAGPRLMDPGVGRNLFAAQLPAPLFLFGVRRPDDVAVRYHVLHLSHGQFRVKIGTAECLVVDKEDVAFKLCVEVSYVKSSPPSRVESCCRCQGSWDC